jgi:CO/xanthine dehydrogenase Mo-binding subunit
MSALDSSPRTRPAVPAAAAPVGTSPPRPDGLAKVSGAAVYADDLKVEGLWYGATVRSPHPRARLRKIRLDRSRAPEGTVLVTASDAFGSSGVPGPNGIQLLDDSWPVLAENELRHVGEPVALVAAPTRLGALQAREAVEVDYEPLPAVQTLEEAERQGLEPLTELAICNSEPDELEAAFAAAPHVVEGTWTTGHQEHIYIEPHAMTAWVERQGGDGDAARDTDGRETVHVHGTLQCPYYVHKALVHVFGLPEDRVRVQASTVGGGFGGKEDFPSVIALHAALLARAAARPVRMTYDRHEDIVGTTKRHPSIVRHRTAFDDEGRLLAMDVDVVLDGGAYLTLSSVVLSRALLHASGPYRCPHTRIRGRALPTYTAPNGAFRGFGAPQTQFAMERQMDRVARVLDLDPLTVRRRNALRPGDRLPTGQVVDDTTSALDCLDEAEARTGFSRRWRELETARREREAAGDGIDEGEPRRGIGLSLYFHGAGFTGNGERRMQSPVTVRLAEEAENRGRVEILTAMTDMGQGTAAVFPQIAEAASGLPAEDLVFVPADTGRVPDSGPTVASRTTMIVGGTLAQALEELIGRVRGWWGKTHGRSGDLPFRDIARRYLDEKGPLEVTLRHRPPGWQQFDERTYRGSAYPAYAWGADVVEVEVDPDTLAVRPVRVTVVCEVGRAIHPRLCAGQIEGGTLQAVGWALCEEVKMEEGRYLNDRLATYIIPTAQDSPEIRVHLLEKPWDGGPFGAKGIGELPMDGGAPAVAQAVENATGLPVTDLPATPERLYSWHREGRRVLDPETTSRKATES